MARPNAGLPRCAGVMGLAMVAGLGIHDASWAAIQTSSPQAHLRLPRDEIPYVFETPVAFSFVMWLYRSASDSQPMCLIDVPGSFGLFVDPVSRGIRASLHGADESLELLLPLRGEGGSVPLGEWMLVAVSWDQWGGLFAGWARSENVAGVEAAAQAPGFRVSPPEGDLSIGRPDVAGAVAQQGIYGLMVFRRHAIRAQDFDDLWISRDYLGPYRLQNTGGGGNLNGTGGALWMVNHAVPTIPSKSLIPAVTAALIDDDVTATNFCLYIDGASGFWDAGSLSAVSSGEAAFVFISPFDVPGAAGGFFQRRLVDIGLAGPPAVVGGVAPHIRNLAFDTPDGVKRVMVSANSRGVMVTDANDRTLPENYAHGFIAQRLASTAGVLNRRARAQGNSRWFGYDCTDPPRKSGTLRQFDLSNAPDRTFTRCWTNSTHGGSLWGPGTGMFLEDGAVFSMKCRPEAGSLMDGSAGDGTNADFPLQVRAYVMKFPGAGSVTWRPERSTAQDVPGTLGGATVVDLDTTVFTYTLTSDHWDRVNPYQREVTIYGDHTGRISVGDACFVSAGTSTNSISVVESVTLIKGPRTELVFERWFYFSPQVNSSTLQFGPWLVYPIDYSWPALSPGDPSIWRGLELTATGGPVVIFSYDAYRPDVAGWAFGAYGTGGDGYTEQIEDAFVGTHHRVIAALEPDIWLAAFAQQNSMPSSMSDFVEIIRDSVPGVEAAWLGESTHQGTSSAWHHYIIDNAASEGLPAVSVIEEPALGALEDQAVDGLRANGSHYSHRGNRRLAERWLALLQEAAVVPGVAGDLDGDGLVGIGDLLVLLEAWGPGPAPCPPTSVADIDADCEVDITDLLMLLGNWDS